MVNLAKIARTALGRDMIMHESRDHSKSARNSESIMYRNFSACDFNIHGIHPATEWMKIGGLHF